VTDDGTDPVYIKTINGGPFVRHFYRDNLVLFDLQTNREGIPRLEKIKPNPLFVDLHNHSEARTRPTTTPVEDPVSEETNSIETVLSKAQLLVTEKPYIFINMIKSGDENVSFVYVAQIVGKTDRRTILRLDTDPEDPENSDSATLVLSPGQYNAMNTKHGWRFVEHNRWLLRADCGPKARHGHYVTIAEDVPLIEYKDVLNDPSYTLREMLNHDIEKNPNMLVRYEARVAALVHKKYRKSTKQTSQTKDNWEIQFVNDGKSKSVTLSPGNYGKPTGWEFVNFNVMFNIHLKQSM
jgi:hypothetical protein